MIFIRPRTKIIDLAVTLTDQNMMHTYIYHEEKSVKSPRYNPHLIIGVGGCISTAYGMCLPGALQYYKMLSLKWE